MVAQKVVYLEYPQLRKDFARLAQLLAGSKYRPERMASAARLAWLTLLERAHYGILTFVERMNKESSEVVCDKRTLRYVNKLLPHNNIITIEPTLFGEYFVKAPPLGDRPGGNTEYISYLTKMALKRALQDGAEFEKLHDGCIIVKQFCHCADVAMGTMENREVHCITDTLVNAMGLDDAPWLFDACYVWCESTNPRTEIVITSRSNVDRLRCHTEYVNSIYETEPTSKQQYRINQTKRDRLLRAVAAIEKLLDARECVEVENGFLDKETGYFLLHLAHALTVMIAALRTPYINDKAHKTSRLYSRNSLLAKRKSPPEEAMLKEIEFNEKIDSMATHRLATVRMRTMSPYSLANEAGRDLCDEQEAILREWAQREDKDCAFDLEGDLALTVTRYIDYGSNRFPDADNINTSFLGEFSRRTKIIYSKALTEKTISSYNCIIELSTFTKSISPFNYVDYPQDNI